jgi:hypothetical protein
VGCGYAEHAYSGSISRYGVSAAADAMSAFMPVLLWLVQWSHECAAAVVKSVVAVARIVDFMVVGECGSLVVFVFLGKREDVEAIWVLYSTFANRE